MRAVLGLLATRKSALRAERDKLLRMLVEADAHEARLTTERDALAAQVATMRETLEANLRDFEMINALPPTIYSGHPFTHAVKETKTALALPKAAAEECVRAYKKAARIAARLYLRGVGTYTAMEWEDFSAAELEIIRALDGKDGGSDA